jgi:hypothetical protein
MTESEILKALDGYAVATSDVAAVGGDDVCREAAALIRRLQDDLARHRLLLEIRRGATDETIHDRDARAALAFLMAHPKPQGMTSAIAAAAWALADAMAEGRALRKASQ